jgi:four helix bundle protein
MARNFKELVAWQKAMDLIATVYEASRRLPADERYGLGQQLRRAAVSVASNIAEGHERRTRGEFRRFLASASGSLAEVETQLLAAERIGILPKSATSKPIALACEVGRIVRGIEKSLGPRPREATASTDN